MNAHVCAGAWLSVRAGFQAFIFARPHRAVLCECVRAARGVRHFLCSAAGCVLLMAISAAAAFYFYFILALLTNVEQ